MILLKSVWLLLALKLASVDGESFRDEALDAHNKVRARHQDTKPLRWNNGLEKSAQKYATKMADNNLWKHDKMNTNYGENLYKSTGSYNLGISSAVKNWYGEGIGYKYNSFFPDKKQGHFTQVVWKSSIRLGCAKAEKLSGTMKTVYIVCRYDPPGNVGLFYRQNVRPLKIGIDEKNKCVDKHTLCKSRFKWLCHNRVYAPFLTQLCSGTCNNLCRV